MTLKDDCLSLEGVSCHTPLLVSICAFLASIGLNFTRVPIIYAFRTMTCDEYYRHHPPFAGTGDRCSMPEIEASTAKAVAFLGATITINGILNIFFTNWSLGVFGIKSVLVLQLVGPTIRLGCQLIGVKIGAGKGMLIVLLSQLMGVVGGSTGYILVLTNFVSRVVTDEQRTASFGRLQGAVMLGTAVAYLLGGTTGDILGTSAAFQGAALVMIFSVLYAILALPAISLQVTGIMELRAHREPPLAKVLIPLRAAFRMSIRAGASQRHGYQRPLLTLGVFFGVLATGFIPILLQMHATNKFGFNSRENGFLMALTFGTRSIFLTFIFPVTIRCGRRWLAKGKGATPVEGVHGQINGQDEAAPLLDSPTKAGAVEIRFDLLFLTVSFFADAILTSLAAFCQSGWHLYMAGLLLPLASGSAPAAKGVIVAFCDSSEQQDILAGIAMSEMLANVTAMAIFGSIFSALAAIQQSQFVFFINGGLALIAGFLVSLIRLP